MSTGYVCGWEGCEREGRWVIPEQHRQFDSAHACSLHHPAGRLHIEELTAERDRYKAALERIAAGGWADAMAAIAREALVEPKDAE